MASPHHQLHRRYDKLAKYLVAAVMYFREVELSSAGLDWVAPTGENPGGQVAFREAIERYTTARVADELVRRPDHPPPSSFPLEVGTLAVAIGRPGSIFVTDARWTAIHVIYHLLYFEGWELTSATEQTWDTESYAIDPAQFAANAEYSELLAATWHFAGKSDRYSFEQVRVWWNGTFGELGGDYYIE